MTPGPERAWSVIILAGGRGARLGGVEKSDLQFGGKTLLEHLLVQIDVPVVVAGPERPVAGDIRFVLEQPRYGGPVAGLRAAVGMVETPLVAILAVDLPRAVPVLRTLVDQWDEEVEALVPVHHGHDQYVCSVFSTDALRRALGECDDSMRSLFSAVEVKRVHVTEEEAALLRDIDTAADLEALQREPTD